MTGPDRARELADRVRTGGLVLLLDDAIDPPEAVLVGAAARVTPEAVNFMVTHGRGLVCLGLTRERMRRLGIPLMASEQSARLPAYGASIEARRGVSTGISASDRATTILAAVAPESTSADLVMPGHITPIQIVSGGSLVRAGLPEAASDLVRLAGLGFEAVLCEVLGRDGNLASGEELVALAHDHHVPAVTVTDVIHMRLRSDTLVRRRAEAALPVQDGATFRAIVYDNSIDQQQHMALVLGELRGGAEVLVRLHSECLTGDVFGSQRCDCGEQLAQAMQLIAAAGQGVLVYLHQEGRGIGLANKIRAYELQDEGFDTVEANERLGFKADQRDYGVGVQILKDLGVRSMRLLSNNPRKLVGIEGYGLSVSEWLPLEIPASDTTRRYLTTKKEKLGHKLSSV